MRHADAPRRNWLGLGLIAVLLVAATPGGASAKGIDDPVLRVSKQVRQTQDLMRTGRLADAVRAAAFAAGIDLAPPALVLPGPVVPVLQAAIAAAGARVAAAIGPDAPQEHGSDISDLLRLATTVPPDADALESLKALQARLARTVDTPAIFSATYDLAAAIDRALPGLRAMRAPATPGAVVAGCDLVDRAPALCIGGLGPNLYTRDAALVIDLGGDDTHTHSAGGAGAPNNLNAAVTIDLGGNDRYLRTNGPAQGAGNLGIGVLVDAAGDDLYSIAATAAGQSAIGQGTNYSAGSGILADLGGNDTYTSTNTWRESAFAAGQGRAAQPGVGILLDHGAGNDTYMLSAHPSAPLEFPAEVKLGGLNANGTGFGSLGGVGILSDGGGADAMTLEAVSATIAPEESRPVTQVPIAGPAGFGAGQLGGVGLVLSGSGDTTRRAVGSTQAPWSGVAITNAFGWSLDGMGALRDEGGDDSYVAIASSIAERNARGGADGTGVRAEARQGIVNVAAVTLRAMGATVQGVALLEDLSGDDVYEATGTTRAVASADDADGAQAVATSNNVSASAQGVASGGIGALLDGGGDDRYSATATSDATARATSAPEPTAEARSGKIFFDAQASAGGNADPGTAVLRDTGGTDSYAASATSTAEASPPTTVTTAAVRSSAQASVTTGSAFLHDRDAGEVDRFELTPPDPACEGTRGQGTWRDCGGPGPGIGIVETTS